MHGMMNGLEKNLNSSFFVATKNRSSIQKKAVARKILNCFGFICYDIYCKKGLILGGVDCIVKP
jgi:hypothetical protein